jgi:hypothetical protein
MYNQNTRQSENNACKSQHVLKARHITRIQNTITVKQYTNLKKTHRIIEVIGTYKCEL